MTPRFPLTDFLIALAKADPRAIARANAGKLADKYDISPAHAVGYLEMNRGK